ncbi:MAG: helix-turn-helix protein [Micrococcaceae bacterium]|nr:helix-turn-helix protein [Micrococcaceae bacterium]
MGQSAEFGRFLKAMRARLGPDDPRLSLAEGPRRVPGLRREEIARLAGVSTDYYTRLEQGRHIHPSRSVLDAVARALNLDSAEHAHMMDLLQNCGGSTKEVASAQRVRPALRQLLDAVGDVPALILGRRTDVLAINRLGALLLADFSALPPGGRNLTRWLMLDPAARALFPDWKSLAAEATAELRADVGRHPDDPKASQLVGELAVHSEHFRQWWAGHRVTTRPSGVLRVQHPVVGTLDLDFETLTVADDTDTTLRIYSARPGSPSSDGLKLLGSWGVGQDQDSTLRTPNHTDAP